MAANRLLRDWTNSEKINGISFQAEVFFTRLIMKADDFGSFHGNVKILKANLFPLRTDTVRDADISRWIAECEKAGLLLVYTNAGKSYTRILDFGQRMRAMKSKFPLPEDSRTNGCNVAAVVSSPPPEVEEKREEEIEIEEKGKRKAFRPPSPEEVVNEFFEKLDDFTAMAEARKFVDFYESKGWIVGKVKMKDWKAAARGWLGRMNQFKNEKDGKRKQGTSEARIDALKNF